jgi:hypothetical protein
MCHMTRSQCTKVAGGDFWGSSTCKDRWTGHTENVGGGDFRGSSAHKDRWTGHTYSKEVEGMWYKHTEKASSGGRRRSGWMASPIDHCVTTSNILGDGSIMVLGVHTYHPSTLMGT